MHNNHNQKRVIRHERGAQLQFLNAQGQWELVRDGLANTLPWEHPDIAYGLSQIPNLDAAHRTLLLVYGMGRPKPEVFPVVDECHGNCARHGKHHWCLEVEINANGFQHYKPHSTHCSKCGYRVGEMPGLNEWLKICESPCNAEPRPFTWQDAERIMLAGGECESRLARSGRFSRCRMVGRELQVLQEFGSPVWERHPGTTPWNEYEWRPCSAPAQYTWEQAEAGMRNLREEWEGKLPTWSGFYVFRLNQDDSQYWYFEVKNPNGWTSFHRIDLLEQCTWRPYNPEAKT